ncbi:hypothetical protein TNCV_2282271 [Trichonephila clavipes]|nr:hypothetical protein TNCV_2282271 [Trichonephila clavipes]
MSFRFIDISGKGSQKHLQPTHPPWIVPYDTCDPTATSNPIQKGSSPCVKHCLRSRSRNPIAAQIGSALIPGRRRKQSSVRIKLIVKMTIIVIMGLEKLVKTRLCQVVREEYLSCQASLWA